MLACPSCARPVAVVRGDCLYCGAPLPEKTVARAAETRSRALDQAVAVGSAIEPEKTAAPARSALILDLRQVEPAVLARALAVPLYEARQHGRAGNWKLLRLGPPDAVSGEAERLRGEGLATLVVPEADILAGRDVLAATGGAPDGPRLQLVTAEGELCVQAADLLLVLSGPITRVFQNTGGPLKYAPLAVPEDGHRIHLHRRDDPRPVELDPWNFDFGAASPARSSSLLTLTSWVGTLARNVPHDDAFRHAAPALAPEVPPAAGVHALPESLRAAREAHRDGERRQVLDNLGQFRFYSAWRGAVARHTSPD